MTTNRLVEAINRINQIDWGNVQYDKPSHTILVFEFIRRGNIFRDIYDKDNLKRLAVFSAAKIINASIPQEILRLINDINLIEQGWTIKSICEYYLEWIYLVDIENEVAIKYSDLYEPIIILFERGGRINYHHHELVCGKVGWPRNCYSIQRREPLEKISDKILDDIDIEDK